MRDWFYVADHCDALLTVFEKGPQGETYNIGGRKELENILNVERLCDLMDTRFKLSGSQSSRRLIQFVKDRPGHDRRYAIDATKIKKELGWTPKHDFEEALEKTVDWYLENMDWVNSVRSGDYLQWVKTNYGNR